VVVPSCPGRYPAYCILYTVYCLLGQAKKDAIQSEIKETDRRIDTLVYELYGLTKEEIGIVEEKQK
jgi:hypothetical protein